MQEPHSPTLAKSKDAQPDTAPDWDNVPFAVRCARCGENLRGLTKPKCPACRLEFDWADAVPLERVTCVHCDYHLYGLRETRCPECGEWFTWDDVLAAYHRRKKPLFEYRWRDRPVRSLLGTWLAAMRPVRFWRNIDLHDPPQVGGLLLMAVLALVAFFVTVTVVDGLGDWIRSLWSFLQSRRGAALGEWLSYLPYTLAMSLTREDAYGLIVGVGVWFVMTFVSLMVFRQSMRRCRVRTAQVLRVWAYAVTPAVPVACVLIEVYNYTTAVLGQRYVLEVEAAVALVAIFQVTRSLRTGYGTYLRMPHSWGVAVASVVMGFLGSTLCMLKVFGGYGVKLYLELLRFLGLL
ncbi:MAG: hypothetical protein ACE5EX_09600 [Phycisphaerae bacterium]